VKRDDLAPWLTLAALALLTWLALGAPVPWVRR